MESDLLRKLSSRRKVHNFFTELLECAWVLQHVIQDGAERNGRRV